jgi:hypothetical protein
MIIAALPTTVLPTLAAEPQIISQQLLSVENSYICCPNEVDLSNPDSIPTDCKTCTPDKASPLLPSLNEDGEIEGIFCFAGRAANGLANWKLSWIERKVEDMIGDEGVQAEMTRMQVPFETAEGGRVGGDAGEREATLGE